MIRQEAFTTAWTKITAQGRPSYNGDSCLYRGPDNTACAIGHLIDDETAKAWDDQTLSGIYSIAKVGLVPEWMAEDITFFGWLQDCHDNHHDLSDEDFVPAFQGSMRSLAQEYHLDVPHA